MHGMRRRILRALNDDRSPQTLSALGAMFPEAGLSQVSYHVLVLGDCGSVAVVDDRHAGEVLARAFVSTVAENPQIVAALQATEKMDEAR